MAKQSKDSINMTTNIPEDLRDDLKRLADESGMTLHGFVRQVLTEVARQKMAFRLTKEPQPLVVSEDAAPYSETPKKGK